MPKFFFHSESGDGLFIARRLEKEGHQVRTYLHDKNAKNVYRGILRTFANNPAPDRGEIVLFDMVKFGPLADRFRRAGYKVIGASRFADAIEVNRPAGAKVMQDIGIRIPETHTFRTLADGQRFLRNAKGKWYYKPSGNLSTASTYNAEPEMLIRYLEWTKKEPPEQFELQKGLDEGTEISLEGWFDGNRWIWPFNSTVEDKKLMTGDKGPRTGCMSNVVWAYEDSRPVLALKTVARLAPVLEAAGHVGPIDLNMILDKEGTPYGLEWSPRFGYDALHALCRLTEGDFGHQLAQFADGRLDAFSTRTDAYAMTLRLTVPPYPDYENAKDAEGTPLDSKLLNDPTVLLGDVMVGPNGLAISGADGSVATLTAVGTDLNDLRKELTEKAGTFEVPNLQYRIDPVQRTESVLTALDNFAYDGPAVRWIPPPPEPVVSKPEKDSRPGKTKGDLSQTPKAPIPVEAPVNWDMPTYK